MDIIEILSIVIYVLVWILVLYEIYTILKQSKKRLEESLELLSELLEKTRKEFRLKEIIVESKLSRENYFITLEKIERELFDNNSLNSENKD